MLGLKQHVCWESGIDGYCRGMDGETDTDTDSWFIVKATDPYTHTGHI